MAYPEKPNQILPQPIDLDKYNQYNEGEYYLSVARLVKSVDQIVSAFLLMPEKKLIVVGSGNEEEKKKINELAKKSDNITILGFVKEEDLPKIYSSAIAVIAINKKEDTPMNLMEGLASGKPSISINQNEYTKQDIEFTNTGVLMRRPTIENIILAVNALNKDLAASMKDACLLKAQRFSKDNYVNTILNKLQQNTP